MTTVAATCGVQTNDINDDSSSSETNSLDSINGSLNHTSNSRNDAAYLAMEKELDKTKQDLEKKNAECENLQSIRSKVENELEDLTASLFEEANKMVYEANMTRHKAEKKLAEAEGMIEALRLEVDALKSLVLTSTPSNPNPTSHPQLIKKKNASPIRNLKLPKSWSKDKLIQPQLEVPKLDEEIHLKFDDKVKVEVDPTLEAELSIWLAANLSSREACGCDTPSLYCVEQCVAIAQSLFLKRVSREDIQPCLDFDNGDLAVKVSKCIHTNSLSVEEMPTSEVSRKCSLTQSTTICSHRLRLGDSSAWYSVSKTARNRITSVCDFMQYIRYIRQGIVKHTGSQIYDEVIKLRMRMNHARLGYSVQ
ncbi:guanine nucleotide exchange factor for Rab-3A isoform X1 [Ciona intestinalis]